MYTGSDHFGEVTQGKLHLDTCYLVPVQVLQIPACQFDEPSHVVTFRSHETGLLVRLDLAEVDLANLMFLPVVLYERDPKESYEELEDFQALGLLLRPRAGASGSYERIGLVEARDHWNHDYAEPPCKEGKSCSYCFFVEHFRSTSIQALAKMERSWSKPSVAQMKMLISRVDETQMVVNGFASSSIEIYDYSRPSSSRKVMQQPIAEGRRESCLEVAESGKHYRNIRLKDRKGCLTPMTQDSATAMKTPHNNSIRHAALALQKIPLISEVCSYAPRISQGNNSTSCQKRETLTSKL